MIVFRPGERVRRISVPVNDDSIAEDNESFLVLLSVPKGARLGISEAQARILASDLPPVFAARAFLRGAPGAGAGTGELAMNVDALKAEASFSLTLRKSPEAPFLGHIHSA